jgi:hypothetical protein
MNLSSGKVMLLAIFGLVMSLSVFACSSPAAQPPTSINEPVAPPATVTARSDNSSSQSPVNSTVRVDVVYFHRPQRCPTCLCFEERVRYVVGTYFQNELDSGKMTFGVYNIGDSQNADIVKKYNAVGSQLFINIVKDGTDNIKDIQDIWSWNCRSDGPGFDQKVKNIIDQSLKGDNYWI